MRLITRGRLGSDSRSLAWEVGNLPSDFWRLWKAIKKTQVANFGLEVKKERGRLCNC